MTYYDNDGYGYYNGYRSAHVPSGRYGDTPYALGEWTGASQTDYDRGHSAGKAASTALGVAATVGLAYYFYKKFIEN